MAHVVRTAVYLLKQKIFVLPFAPDFFGSPASGSYAYPIISPMSGSRLRSYS